MAPEALKEEEAYYFATDMWSVGVVLIEKVSTVYCLTPQGTGFKLFKVWTRAEALQDLERFNLPR